MATESFYMRHPMPYESTTKFLLPIAESRSYCNQFSSIYNSRYSKIKPIVQKKARASWNRSFIDKKPPKEVLSILDVQAHEYCWVIGTVYTRPHLTALDKDGLRKYAVLEDDSGQLRLDCSKLLNQNLVPGCVVAVLGKANTNGDFEVMDIECCKLGPQAPRASLYGEEPALYNEKIAVVSGVTINNPISKMTLQLLTEFLTEVNVANKHLASRISRLFCIGSICDDSLSTNYSPKLKDFYLDESQIYNHISALTKLDIFLSDILPTLPITFIPGLQSSIDQAYPQQPVHLLLLPRCRSFVGILDQNEYCWFDRTTNPLDCEIQGIKLFIENGFSIRNISDHINESDPTEVMHMTLKWHNGAPSAPSSISCFPYKNLDPFVFEEAPHIFITGNQKFGTKLLSNTEVNVRLISVPNFTETGIIIIIDPKTFELECLKFTSF